MSPDDLVQYLAEEAVMLRLDMVRTIADRDRADAEERDRQVEAGRSRAAEELAKARGR